MAIDAEALPLREAVSGGLLSEILPVSRGLGESPNTGDPVLKPETSADIEVSSRQRTSGRRIARTAGPARLTRSLRTHRNVSTEIDQQHRQTRLS
jgi:hypothetical protein